MYQRYMYVVYTVKQPGVFPDTYTDLVPITVYTW